MRSTTCIELCEITQTYGYFSKCVSPADHGCKQTSKVAVASKLYNFLGQNTTGKQPLIVPDESPKKHWNTISLETKLEVLGRLGVGEAAKNIQMATGTWR